MSSATLKFRPAVLARCIGAALAVGQLAACATGPAASAVADVPANEASATAPVQAAPVSVAAPPVVAPASAPAPAYAEPIIIRGNDRLVGGSQSAAGAIKGPASSYKFEDAPSTEVVHVVLRDILKVDYVIYPPLPGTITLATRGPISAERALLLLENALQVNGVVMSRDARGTYHVGRAESLRGIVAAPQVAGRGPLAPGYGAVIYPLQYLGATEMASILQPLVPADAIVRVDTVRNILVMQGTRAQAEGWTELVNTFDVNILRGMSVGVFPLKHTSAAEVDAALRMLSGAAAAAPAGSAPQAGAARGAPPAAAASANAAAAAGGIAPGNPLFGALRVMPIERINAVMVVTPRAAYLDEVRYWIEQFDRPNLNSAEPQLFVYKVQNGSSTHLAELLNGIYGGVAQAPGATGATGIAPGLTGVAGTSTNVNNSFASQFGGSQRSLFGAGTSTLGTGVQAGLGSGLGSGGLVITGSGLGGTTGGLGGLNQSQGQQGPNVVTTTLGQSVRVMADRINNTLLIHATPAEYERIESTLKRLDVQRAQVLIEASIVEVTLGDGLEYGLQWAFKGGLGGGREGMGLLGTAAGGAGSSVKPGSSSAFAYTLSNAAGNISAVLSALASKSLIKVMSSPSLMVLDNHTAAIQVGNQQPVSTGTTVINPSTSGAYTTNSIQYKDTGVMLGVTPSVSAGDLVTLDINQMVTDLDDAANSALKDYPTFMQRQINSKVAVRSGETLVLGGLIKDRASSGKSGLPLLSSIPVVGALFGTHTTKADRTELLVILTPRVLRSDDDARAVSRELRDRMRGLTVPGPAAPR